MSALGEKLLEGLDKAKAKAHDEGKDLIAEKGPEGIDKVLDKGEELLEGLVTDEDMLKEGREAIDLVRGNKTPFLRLGEDGFARLLGYWENADERAARLHYLEHEATYDEARAAMHAGTDQLIEAEDRAKAAKEAAWETVREVLKKVGTAGLGLLVRAAAASIGIPLA